MKEGCYAKVIADSISPLGVRLTSILARYYRGVHVDLMTHKLFERNASSSRAIPVERTIELVEQQPFVPWKWGLNRKGMQAKEWLTGADAMNAEFLWRESLNHALDSARHMMEMKIHKTYANRILEPYSYITTIITSTDWANFFALRCHPDADPALGYAAALIRQAYFASTPTPIPFGSWHLPFMTDGECTACDDSWDIPRRVSSARCARASYMNFKGDRELADDLRLYNDTLMGDLPLHASPLAHVCTPMTDPYARCGPIRGWRTHRSTVENEAIWDINHPAVMKYSLEELS